MKYLRDEQKPERCLQLWAGSSRLATAGFFFWISGTEMQKSQCGLLQQLLFEILRTLPDWMPLACPARWALSQHDLQSGWSSRAP